MESSAAPLRESPINQYQQNRIHFDDYFSIFAILAADLEPRTP
jgi:hypothetical protein